MEVQPSDYRKRISALMARQAAKKLGTRTLPEIRFFYDGLDSSLRGFCTRYGGIFLNASLDDMEILKTVLHESYHWREFERPISQRYSRESEERRAVIFELEWPRG